MGTSPKKYFCQLQIQVEHNNRENVENNFQRYETKYARIIFNFFRSRMRIQNNQWIYKNRLNNDQFFFKSCKSRKHENIVLCFLLHKFKIENVSTFQVSLFLCPNSHHTLFSCILERFRFFFWLVFVFVRNSETK